jgi:hypothetical protein
VSATILYVFSPDTFTLDYDITMYTPKPILPINHVVDDGSRLMHTNSAPLYLKPPSPSPSLQESRKRLRSNDGNQSAPTYASASTPDSSYGFLKALTAATTSTPGFQTSAPVLLPDADIDEIRGHMFNFSVMKGKYPIRAADGGEVLLMGMGFPNPTPARLWEVSDAGPTFKGDS